MIYDKKGFVKIRANEREGQREEKKNQDKKKVKYLLIAL